MPYRIMKMFASDNLEKQKYMPAGKRNTNICVNILNLLIK